MGSFLRPIALSWCLIALGVSLPANGQKLYWLNTEAATLMTADVDGKHVDTLHHFGTPPNDPVGIAVDSSGGRIYWVDRESRCVQRANLDGSDVEKIIPTGLLSPRGIALDLGDGTLYVADPGRNRIYRANLDGSNLEPIVDLDAGAPWDVELDVANGKLYWSNSAGGHISRADLDGSNQETVVPPQPNHTYGIALDIEHGWIYWASDENAVDSENDVIRRARLDGSDVQTVVVDDLIMPVGVEVDLVNEKLYWSDAMGGKVRRADLEGQNAEDVLGYPWVHSAYDLAIDTAASVLYVLDRSFDRIARVDLDGANPALVPVWGTSPVQLAFDPANAQLYWAEFNGRRVRRASIHGTDVVTIVHAEANVWSVSLDLAAGKVYWLENLEGTDRSKRIRRAGLDGSNVEEWVTQDLIYPNVMALNAASGHVYWADYGDFTIRRTSVRDPGPIETITLAEADVGGFAFDYPNGKVYWTLPFSNVFEYPSVVRADFDGVAREAVLFLDPKIGYWLFDPAIDPIGQDMYLDGNVAISRTALGGSEMEQVLPYEVTGRSTRGVVVDPCSRDDRVRRADHAAIVDCLGGPGSFASGACHCADFSGDARVDLVDFAIFQRVFHAP